MSTQYEEPSRVEKVVRQTAEVAPVVATSVIVLMLAALAAVGLLFVTLQLVLWLI
jgi:hypothetical protein